MKVITVLEVWPENLPGACNWYDADKACKALGEGWRLPTKEELNLLFQNKNVLGGFGEGWLWSSSQYVNYYAWEQRFLYGHQDNNNESYAYGVRAVRATVEVVE